MGLCRSHASVADWEAFNFFTVVEVMNDWGEPASSSGTSSQLLVAAGPLYASTFIVNDASSTARVPLVGHGPYSRIGGGETGR